MANAVGLLVLFLLVAIVAKFLPIGDGAPILWLVVYLVLATAAWRAWHEKDAPDSPLGWLGMAVGAIVVGAIFFMIDVSAGHSKDPSLSTFAAAQAAGGMFGFVFTATVCPAAFVVAIAGMARSAYLALRGRA